MSIFDITELIKICKYARGKCVLELVSKQTLNNGNKRKYIH